MKINKDTSWEEIASAFDCLTEESRTALVNMSLKIHGIDDFTMLSVGELINITNGDISFLNIKDESKAFEKIFVEELKKYIETFLETYGSYSLPQTADEKTASKSCVPFTFAESLLIFVRSYFGLHSFLEAEQIKLGEVLIAKKDAYNTAIFNKTITKIQTRKR